MIEKGTTATGNSVCTFDFNVYGCGVWSSVNCLLPVCNLSTCYRKNDVWFKQRFMSLCTNLINSHVHMHKWHNDVIIKYVEKIFLAEYSNMPPLPVKERQLYSLLRSSLWNSFLDHLSWKINRAFISCWTLSVCLFIMFYIGNQPNLTQKTLDETIFKLPTWMIEKQILKQKIIFNFHILIL